MKFWWTEIKKLRTQVASLTTTRDFWVKRCEENIQVKHAALEELDARTEESDRFRQEANDLRTTTAALNQENADLVYQLELYRSVLKQLRIPVTIPVRNR